MEHRGGSARPVVALVLLTLLVLPAAVAWARTPGGEAVVGHPAVAGFRQHAAVDRDRYGGQEAVVLTYRVCRARPWPTITNSPGRSGLAVGFRVLDEQGDVVADNTHEARILVLVRTPWLPGQCRSMDVRWDQHAWNRVTSDGAEPGAIGVPVRGDRVAPGSYRFEVRWLVSSGSEPDEELPAAIRTAPFVLEP